MKRKLFCEISPFTYAISVKKMRFLRRIKNLFCHVKFAETKSDALPIVVYNHKSLIRRKLGDVDMSLQENKAVNLSLAAPKIDGVLIRPNEVFSFWQLVGACSKRRGYQPGLIVSSGKPLQGIGGGMCQFTNLLHWLVLHSPLEIVEHHYHDDIDMFPDYGRQVPFGCGTSIMFNYLDYRVKNNTTYTFQFLVYTNEKYLCGELRADQPLPNCYHIRETDQHFARVAADYYRRNIVTRHEIDKRTGREVQRIIIKKSNAKVLYHEAFIPRELIRHSQ